MKIATWNVNSLKVRLPHVLDWLAANQPDALCLQELKCENKAFPLAEIEAAGYQAVFSGQKTYNGVAILSKKPLLDVSHDIPDFADEQKRIIAGTLDGVRIVCGYFPNGQAVGSEKFAYKLAWLEALTTWLRAELQVTPRLVLAGDYNVAPEDRDAHPDWKDAFRRNFGLRIDHLLLSAPLAEKCTACYTDKAPRKLERPSDHTPVIVEIAES